MLTDIRHKLRQADLKRKLLAFAFNGLRNVFFRDVQTPSKRGIYGVDVRFCKNAAFQLTTVSRKAETRGIFEIFLLVDDN